MPEEKPKPESSESIGKRYATKIAMSRQFAGGVIAVVHTAEQATIAETYGACGVIVISNTATKMLKANANISRAADPAIVKSIMSSMVLPVIGRVRVGHTMEARVMESCGVNAIDESETLETTSTSFIKKHPFKVPFICGVANLAEALQRTGEGASMLRSKVGSSPKTTGVSSASKTAGGGSVEEDKPTIRNAINCIRTIQNNIEKLIAMTDEERQAYIKKHTLDPALVEQVIRLKRLPLPLYADGGVVFPMDVAMLMDTGYDGVIASVQLFQAPNSEKRMRALVLAATHYKNPHMVASISEGLGDAGAVV
ncbi:Pyridoxal 5'-phosphate synthase subunit snz1 [Coemansia guatemalensis]|uniref:pyridoxal 5'-phosphate synthase (glutamine hydrolyzing) n=1 Tax=Coemansia guatemalensis TaxID=2761395 RepID=A0A9W8LVJ6_9FUNG|nr:Pyridoxal 5'-phosphate synthase subunit snz1 [Coemansia guatemalensis]